MVAARENRQLLNAARCSRARAPATRAPPSASTAKPRSGTPPPPTRSPSTRCSSRAEGGELSQGLGCSSRKLDARVGSRDALVCGVGRRLQQQSQRCKVHGGCAHALCAAAARRGADLAARVYGWATSADGPGGGGAAAASRAVLLDQLLLTLLPRIASYDNDDGVPEMAAVRRAGAAAAVVNDSHLAAAADAAPTKLRRRAAVHRTQARPPLSCAPSRAGDVDGACRTLWEAEQRQASSRRGSPSRAEGLRSPTTPTPPRASPTSSHRSARVRCGRASSAAAASGWSTRRARWRRPTTSRTAAAAATTASAAATTTPPPARPSRPSTPALPTAPTAPPPPRRRRRRRRRRSRGGGGGAADDARRRRPVSAAAAAAAAPSVLRSSHYSRQAAIAMRLALAELKALQQHPADAGRRRRCRSSRAASRRAAAAAAAATTGSATRRCSSATPRFSECSSAPGRRRPTRAAGRVELCLMLSEIVLCCALLPIGPSPSFCRPGSRATPCTRARRGAQSGLAAAG